MQSAVLPPTVLVGGIGCKHCVHWCRYTDNETKDLLSLTGDWGKCVQENTNKKLVEDYKNTDGRAELAKAKIERIVMPLAACYIVSTEHSHKCENYKARRNPD